jgi:PmbA protein
VSDLQAIASRIVNEAKERESVEAYVSRSVETDLTAYGGEVESLTQASSSGVGVRILVPSDDGFQVGFSWAGSLDDDAVRLAVSQARENAGFSSVDPYAGLAEPDGFPIKQLDLVSPLFSKMSIDDKIALALELERATLAGDPRIKGVDHASYGDVHSEAAIATTSGITTSDERTGAYLSVSALAGDDTETQSGYGLCVSRDPYGLDADLVVRDALERSTRLLGGTKPQSGRVTMVLDPRVTATVLGQIASALSGDAVARGRSFFVDRIGEVVASQHVTLVDDPTDTRFFGASSVDAEGLACRRNVLISEGRLERFVYDTQAARRAGTRSTGSAVRGGFAGRSGAGCQALLLTPGDDDLDALLARVGDGIYVQSISGVHSGVSSISGDFSVGAEGLIIRNGVLAEAFREATVASTLQRMLQNVSAVGSDLTWLPGLAAGLSVAISDVQLSGR